ncbi:S26 family signal peptidase [Algisphaera agarilytica]|uniref:Signal peptidase I n=1 Tax=Algisphaera agarilytica TaxID=1385975 RepID=A0A7X0HA56_9BACT|nr:S26 family signal peptidase [Algisphaera agarilytica]MBB6430986.1 signal peptidase I [Algisphaera agarilytica]
MSQPHSKSNARHPKSTDETIKETFESIVIAFILAFIFRAYVVEAFIIPTGSMAPTLLGEHAALRCEQCGYDFAVDQSGQPNRMTRNQLQTATCPMCKYPQPVPLSSPTQTGDRLLVQKYVYYVAEPTRWDVVVFKNPQRLNDNGSPGPKTNYIKRLVGLPNESLHLIDGNVYVRPFDQPSAPWRIARKTDPKENRHWEKIQRAVWQPIYHSQYVPLDHGRALPSPGEDNPNRYTRGRRFDWDCPWVPPSEQVGAWDLGNAEEGWKRSYSFNPTANATGGSPSSSTFGELRFNWAEYHGRGTFYPYNTLTGGRGVFGRQPIEDIRLAATVERGANEDLSIEFVATTRLEHEVETVVARFNPDGKVELLRENDSGRTTLALGQSKAWPDPPRAYELELWIVDQELLVWVDGELVIRKAFDLPMDTLKLRVPPQDRPEVTIRVIGGSATLHGVELDRDIAYTPSLSSNAQVATFGAMRRAANGTLREVPPIPIRPGRYFVLGDNSPISSDGRFWGDVQPWIEKRMFEEADDWEPVPGYPFARDYAHVVPRGLMVGRAFFIYFPAPYAVSPGGQQLLPNFGDMRFVH